MRVAIDIDEVLCPFLGTMTKWRYPKFTPPKRHAYHYASLFKISEKEAKKMVDTFYFTRDFAEMKPFPESQVHLKHLKGKGFDLYAVTGRQTLARPGTEDWLNLHYPGVFKDLVLTNSYTDWELPKVEVCKSLALDKIVDDNYAICMECKGRGIHPIHFIGNPVYPWARMNEHAETEWSGVYMNILENTSKFCSFSPH